MTHNRIQLVRSWLLAACIVGSSLTVWNCSAKKTESSTENGNSESIMDDSIAASDSSGFGPQVDTTDKALNAPKQAPPR